MEDFIAQGTYGQVYRRGSRAVKKFNAAPPDHLSQRVLPALAPFIMAAECAVDDEGAVLDAPRQLRVLGRPRAQLR